MSDARDEFRRGIDALKVGNRSAALSGFIMALALDLDVAAHRQRALEVLGTTTGYTALPQTVSDGLAR